MDKRMLCLILLGIVGILILVIGIKAATIYIDPPLSETRDRVAQSIFGKNYNQLTIIEQNIVDFSTSPPSIQAKNAQFTRWLVTWIVKPLGLFAILTAALVAGRLIVDKIRPPSGHS